MVYSHSHGVLTWIKILELKMIVMFEGEVNFISVIRSVVRICLLSNSTIALLTISISTWWTAPVESPNHTWPHGIQSQPQTWLKNGRTQNDPHVRTRGQFYISDTLHCTNMSLEQLHRRSALRFNLNVTNYTVRLTQSYMKSISYQWYIQLYAYVF